MNVRRAIHLYLESLQAQNYAPRTIDTQAPHLEAFASWLETQGIEAIDAVDLAVLRAHHAALMGAVTRFNRPPSLSRQIGRLCTIRSFFRFLVERQWLLVDPSRDLEIPRGSRRSVPHDLPTAGEMRRILHAPDTTTILGIRDRAILEVLYSSGLRNAELRGLRVWDVDLEEGVLIVVRGKGRKDRVLPLGREACQWVRRYLEEARPRCIRKKAPEALFLTASGNPLPFDTLIRIVKNAVRRARITKRITAHTLRHACATHMLAGGADIRYLQQLLGHRSLSSTTIYTQVAIQDLKRVHRRCHPRAGKLSRRSVVKNQPRG